MERSETMTQGLANRINPNGATGNGLRQANKGNLTASFQLFQRIV